MILVTGPTGTVGSQVVRALQALGARFQVASRHPDKVRAQLGPDLPVVPLDFDDPPSLKRAFQSAGKLFLLTPGAPPDDPQAKAAIDAAREAGLIHVVRLSALAADQNPTYAIARIHREVELYLLASGLTATILRPNHFMENLLNQAPTIKSEGKFYTSSAGAKISMIAAKDIGAVAAHILTNEGFENQSFDLTGPEAITYAEAAAALSQATGRHLEHVPITDQQAKATLLAAGVPAPIAGALIDLAAFDRTGGMSQVNNNVQTITGAPPQSIRSWAEAHAAAFLA